MIPSLSVDHTLALRSRNEQPALSSPAKPSRSDNRPSTNHLKPTGTSYSARLSRALTRSIMLLHSLLVFNRHVLPPVLAIRKQVVNAGGQIVVRWQQPAPLGNNSVTVVVGVAGKCDVELVFPSDQPLHRIRRGRVHANLAVPVHAHESKGWIDRFVYNR